MWQLKEGQDARDVLKERNEFIGLVYNKAKSMMDRLRNPAGVNANLAFQVRGLECDFWCVRLFADVSHVCGGGDGVCLAYRVVDLCHPFSLDGEDASAESKPKKRKQRSTSLAPFELGKFLVDWIIAI